MNQIPEDLRNSPSFEEKNGEQRIICPTGNFVFMFCWSIIYVGLPLSLLYFTKFMGPISTAISIFAGTIGLILTLYSVLPMYGQFLRGKCVLKISNGCLKNHKITVPIDQIKAVKIRKHPNPLKLWVYDYLVVTDIKSKKHYFNLYNLVINPTVLLMIDEYVFNKKA